MNSLNQSHNSNHLKNRVEVMAKSLKKVLITILCSLSLASLFNPSAFAASDLLDIADYQVLETPSTIEGKPNYWLKGAEDGLLFLKSGSQTVIIQKYAPSYLLVESGDETYTITKMKTPKPPTADSWTEIAFDQFMIDRNSDGMFALNDLDEDGLVDDLDERPRNPLGDIDGDGIADALDTDRDGDGFANDIELAYGGDPDYADKKPKDADGDGIPNDIDEDYVSTGVVYYYISDHLGTPQLLVDENQEVVWEGRADAFGETQEVINEVEQPLRFQGQYYDKESGLHYNHWRYYDPTIGRYTQSDRLGLYDGPNTFAYVHGNPLKYVDPTGENAVAAVGGLIYETYDAATGGTFDTCKITGALADGYNGEGDGFASALAEDVLTFGAGALGAAVKLGNAIRAAAASKAAAREIGILRDAAKGKGNFGLGSGTRTEAKKLGDAWVGPGARLASDGKTLVSKDGLKVYRPPSSKPNSLHAPTGTQANFERKLSPGGRPIGNGHLDITD